MVQLWRTIAHTLSVVVIFLSCVFIGRDSRRTMSKPHILDDPRERAVLERSESTRGHLMLDAIDFPVAEIGLLFPHTSPPLPVGRVLTLCQTITPTPA